MLCYDQYYLDNSLDLHTHHSKSCSHPSLAKVVLTTVWEVQTVPTPTQHVTAMCAAALRMLNAITMTASVI